MWPHPDLLRSVGPGISQNVRWKRFGELPQLRASPSSAGRSLEWVVALFKVARESARSQPAWMTRLSALTFALDSGTHAHNIGVFLARNRSSQMASFTREKLFGAIEAPGPILRSIGLRRKVPTSSHINVEAPSQSP